MNSHIDFQIVDTTKIHIRKSEPIHIPNTLIRKDIMLIRSPKKYIMSPSDKLFVHFPSQKIKDMWKRNIMRDSQCK